MLKELIKEKLQILRDFGIITNKDQKATIRHILAQCKSEAQIEQKLYNLIHGSETLEEFLDKHMPIIRQMEK